jgi:hypothetical protein
MNNWQMLYMEMIIDHENHTKYINTFWGKNAETFITVKPGDIYTYVHINRKVLKG